MTPYFEAEGIRIFHQDCLEAMGEMKDGEYELAIVDPPYFSGPDKLGYYGGDVSQTKVKRQAYKILSKWDVPNNPYFIELFRVSKNQIIWGINYFSILNPGPGRIIWDKINDKSTFSDGGIAYCSLIDTVRFIRLMWNGMLQYDMKNKEIRIHPTQKPVRLYQWLLLNYAKPGGVEAMTCFLYYHTGICRHPERYGMACDEGGVSDNDNKREDKGGY